jgi:hypothetical protein
MTPGAGFKLLALEEILKQSIGPHKPIKARDRFNAAQRLGAKPDFLGFWLKLIPYLSGKKEPLVKGRKNRAVSKIPAELNAAAALIEEVNASRLISPVTVLPNFRPEPFPDLNSKFRPGPFNNWIREGVQVKKAAEFAALPGLLRDYAACLNYFLSLEPEFRSCSKGSFSDRQIGEFALLSHFQQQTGEPHFALVADLLNAAFMAADKDHQVKADSLEKLWKDKWFLAFLVQSNVPLSESFVLPNSPPSNH